MNQPVVNLIETLNSNSEKDRYNALLEFLLSHPDVFSPEEKEHLIAAYKASKDRKVAQGKQDAEKRWSKNQDRPGKNSGKQRHDGKWIFIKSSSYGSRCQGCSSRYEIGDPIFCRNSKGYHLTCAEPEAKSNIHYQQWLQANGTADSTQDKSPHETHSKTGGAEGGSPLPGS